jgi:hypothetical protein
MTYTDGVNARYSKWQRVDYSRVGTVVICPLHTLPVCLAEAVGVTSFKFLFCSRPDDGS